ncbi:MAG: zinc ribbon domain-containing protein [Parolsenella sp.]|uniref:zinc ribbon domain-containing protein n=1 Tax=Parolsenella sp. TaxID=2083006 RepID=UPI002E783F25|nr:zinc ribbon domain-containing protein [Parolsenella sp.]MEE1373696.1 zinc ribbon domain-containing protein [Parolsenella sp.]
MGFLDSLQSSVNSATAAASRATSTLKLKSQMSEALKRRQGYAAQLGASLYEATKDNPELRAGREALFDGIAACDAERAQLQAQIDQIEAEAAAAEAAASYYVCPFCHSRVGATDLFCMGCGKPMAEIQAALAQQQVAAAPAPQPQAAGATCPQCGAPVNPGDAFCMSCGCKLGAPAPAPAPAPTPVPIPDPVFSAPVEAADPAPEATEE